MYLYVRVINFGTIIATKRAEDFKRYTGNAARTIPFENVIFYTL